MRNALCCLLVAFSVAGSSIAQAAEGCDAPGLSQSELNDCYGNAHKKGDAELNVLYRRITERLKDDEATTKLLGSSIKLMSAPRPVRWIGEGYGSPLPTHQSFEIAAFKGITAQDAMATEKP